ncbi:OLC1v1024624C1 [Oldenlandia corymbosa var. corymbosa]|uniref:OLC1v1024624C1 n=1 Tax=Oldenlandia corymbosa var. corymbosa TaxID=529605 RepID=A0AAV1C2T9_OLDCO|nr:OLC1v1024624C1 [Oldenlandia corymbosa var. corymbosa]
MVGTLVLYQNHFMLPQEDSPKSPEIDFRLKEQECISLMKGCNSLEEFKQVHAQIIKLGLIWSSFCASNLVATCALSDWGSMDYACSIFSDIDDPGTFDFNTIMRGCIQELSLEEALFLYIEMLERGVEPDNFTYPALLKACALLTAIEEGMQVHGHVFKLGLQDDLYVQNSLINMYGKCRKIRSSCLIFEQMDQKSIGSWSALISAHANLGMWSECLKLFRDMNSEGFWRAEESVMVSVLSACSHLGALDFGRSVHCNLLRNLSGLNVIVQTSLIDMYVRCGCIEKGLYLFDRMEGKNQMSYSVMISGLALHGRGDEALKVFSKMLDEQLEPDDVVYVGVLSACSRSGLVQEGLEFFERMRLEHQIEPTLEHYGCMVDLMGKAGMLSAAFDLIKSMPMKPNDVVWRSLLSACKVHSNVELAEVAAKNLFQQNCQTASDYLTLSNLYAKAQKWQDAACARAELADNEGLNQEPGYCSVEVQRKVYKFLSQDKFYTKCEGVREMLREMEWQLKFEGYSADTSQVLLDVDEEEKRKILGCHSQKLSIAFALIHTSQHSPIRIVRNVKMCSDCHTYTKFISTIYEREITVRDRNRFHHFKNGTCSCKDYW